MQFVVIRGCDAQSRSNCMLIGPVDNLVTTC
jgi:hypothetical protein